MTPVSYDSDVLKAYAAVLYQQAERLVLWATVRWATVGALIGFALAAATQSRAVDDAMYERGVSNPGAGLLVLALVLAVVFGLIGRSRAKARAWLMRLDAQRTLCQVQIEENTRH